MSNSQNQEKDGEIYPVHTIIFEDFLAQNGYIGVEITPVYSIFKKGECSIEIPHSEKLENNKILDIMSYIDIPITEFEEYYKSLKGMDTFNQLIDLSIGTLKK